MAKLKKHTNGRYYVHYHDGTRSRAVSTRCTEKPTAEKWMAQWTLGSHPAEPDTLTVAEALSIHYQDHGHALRSQAAMASRQRILTEHLGGLTPKQLTKARLNQYARDRSVKRGTLRTELSHLQAALNHCVKDGYLAAAPTLDLPKPSPVKDRILSPEEAERLLEASEGDLHAFILIGLETGARLQAILDLTWERVDLERGLIDFLPEGEVQTTKRRPTVPISKRLKDYLGNRQGKGRAIRSCTIPYQFKQLCNRLGLENVTPHTLRHSFISQALMAGKDIYLVAKFVGDNVSTIEQRYAKYRPDYLQGMGSVWRCDGVSSASTET